MVYLHLSDDFGYVLLIDVLIAFEIIVIGFIIPTHARKKFFTPQFMKQNFGKQNMEAFNQQIKEGGYPDMGSGRYADKLTYKQWYQFNSAQRAHYNYVEWIASTLIFIAVSGIYFPIPAASLGLAVFIGRLIYSIGYMAGGPKGRTVGALINDFGILGVFVLSVISSIYFITGKDI